MEENKHYVCLKNKKLEIRRKKEIMVAIYKAEFIEFAYYKLVHST